MKIKPDKELLEKLKATGENAIKTAEFDIELWTPILKQINKKLEKLKKNETNIAVG